MNILPPMHAIRFFYAVMIAAGLLITVPHLSAYAEDQKTIILEVDTKALEENGLIDSSHPDYLAKDIYDDHQRSLLTYLFETLEGPGKSVITQKLYRGIMLGGYRTDKIDNDLSDEMAAGRDFLTLRIKALLRAGYFEDALSLYTASGSPPYHPALAEAGISAMLLTHQTSLACVEYKTLSARHFKGEFWDGLAALCNHVFDEKKDAKDAAKTKTGESVPTIIEAYLKTDAQKQAYRLYEFDQSGALIPEDIVIDAVAYGLWDQDKLRSYYKRHDKASSFKAISSAEDDDAQWALLRDEIRSKPAELMIAYIPMLNDIEPEQLSPETMIRLVDIFYRGRDDIPNFLLDAIEDIDLETDSSSRAVQLKLIHLALDKGHTLDAEDFHNFMPKSILEHNDQKKYYFNIMKKLDMGFDSLHNPAQAYEKDLRLTSMGNYVMPYRYVWDRLLESSKGRRYGETVLLSISMLRQSSVDKIYPGLSSDIRNALLEAGYRKHFSDLVLETMLMESL